MSVDYIREKRLMVFTSLIRTLDFVSHVRVLQCYDLFNKYVEGYPLIDGYTRTGQNLDHNNMRMFLKRFQGGDL